MIDETDLRIIRLLWDGRKSFADMAKELGLSTNTVRNRVNRLIQRGVLQIIGLVDPQAVPGHYSAVLGIRAEPKKARRLLERIGKMKGVVTAACVTGRFDIIAIVFFNEENTHRDFLFEKLANLDGLISVETFFTMDAVGWQLRYVL